MRIEIDKKLHVGGADRGGISMFRVDTVERKVSRFIFFCSTIDFFFSNTSEMKKKKKSSRLQG